MSGAKRPDSFALTSAPGAQGDVWQAMRARPRVIVLIDGVFEAQPSVWHHELRAALDAGITVFGASSMGALRAAELAELGMIGVGTIAAKYRSGEWNDDADVALLHGPAEFDFRAMTLPVVNVWHTAQRAKAAGALTAREARELVAYARELFFQDRTEATLFAHLARRWKPARVARLRAAWPSAFEDLKRLDARLALETAASFLKHHQPPPTPRPTALSSYARHRWLERAYSLNSTPGAQLEGLRHLLLAELARARGLRPNRESLARWGAHFERRGVDASHAERWAEVMALEEAALEHHVALAPGRAVASEAAALIAHLPTR